MTGSLFNTSLVTNLELSQSIANGIFTVNNTGIPQDNKIVTAYSASYYTQLTNLGYPSNQCPTWQDLYAAAVSRTPITINPSGILVDGVYNVRVKTSSISGVAVDVNCYCEVVYYSGVMTSNYMTQLLTIASGDTQQLFPITSATHIQYVSIYLISPTASPTQRYIAGPNYYG